MENLVGPMLLQGLRAGILSMPLPEARDLQVVALADIAGFVRLALERPGEFQGKRIEIASDSLSGPEAASVLAQVTGTSISFSESSLADVRAQSEELARMWEWFDKVGYSADLEALRRTYPEVGWHTLEHWAQEQDWTVSGAVTPEQPSA